MNVPALPLETARLRIEPYQPADLERLHRIFADPETMRFWPAPFTPERTRAWIERALVSYDEIGIGRAALIDKATGMLIGDAGIARTTVEGEVVNDLGAIVAAELHGHGYATEAVRALIAVAFGKLRLPEIHANMPVEHLASRRLAEKAGMRYVRTFANAANGGVATAMYAAHAPPAHHRARVKICGMTSPYDAELAVAAGADAIGMIFAPSARRVDLATAREIVRAVPPLVDRVVVFVDAPGDEVLRVCDALAALPQFSGTESVEYCTAFGGARYIRVLRVHAGELAGAASGEVRAGGDGRMLPFFEPAVAGQAGGSGRTFDWSLVEGLARRRPIGISGGLTPLNVAECVRSARPYAVDVRSGVESHGKKDFALMQAFVGAAAFAALTA